MGCGLYGLNFVIRVPAIPRKGKTEEVVGVQTIDNYALLDLEPEPKKSCAFLVIVTALSMLLGSGAIRVTLFIRKHPLWRRWQRWRCPPHSTTQKSPCVKER